MADSEAKAKLLRRELDRQYEYILDPGDGSQTVGVFLEKWLEGVAKQRVRPSTFPSYAWITHQHLVPGVGRHRPDRLAPEHVAALPATKSAGGLSPRRVQYIRAVLRMGLATAVE